MNDNRKRQLRHIPSVHDLMQGLRSYAIAHEVEDDLLTLLCQEAVQNVRDRILTGDITPALTDSGKIEQAVFQRVEHAAKQLLRSPLQALINGTGVVLHTNLGRAKLSQPAQQALSSAARHYTNLEYNLTEGTRGSRHALVEDIICRLTGAEAALVCNNNAAAVFLTLQELAMNKEVIVSRGELVEIGGSFRVSEIMQRSGAHLVEIGTTNKTHLYDYERAFTDDTALVMKVHTSNFVVKGFTAAVPGAELVSLAHERGIPVFEDLGSGVLLDLRRYGIGEEPTVQEVLQEGIDLVSFSGDKLLGGPQAGIIAGKKTYIDRLKKNQLLRGLRVDKFTLAALHATLKAYLHPQRALQEIPTLHMMLQTEDEIRRKAKAFMSRMNQNLISAELIRVQSEVGGGTMPEVRLPSWGLQLTSRIDRSIAAFAKRLRHVERPVIGRIHQDRYILDFRTIDEEHDFDDLQISLEQKISSCV